ncbi:probable phosphoglycolate phosphatase, HAD superfamily [Thermococcus kodakarensis KOD1]|uniref:Probable phosphoglycolate phosphatase, HAD superfamily n=1 Tax=Thermococcus kodakarensis (strain ATCC BAA-918 / JCM 12380 / KOD1) TaxID=69014 RepID=Q5JED4_THEKO|nr:HAD family hydrolase [Thermococcus kodakarensis]WCN28147.1 HAD family hydrolase [Thermococcus kodakarensis]WCN30445.1 HAD family hydrolase [Thermococcus kodakarensis]BAD84215.1 probable phosphoglycolate phosphatase, HAD superfamily [Thermococcus kodakarensis KOD1]
MLRGVIFDVDETLVYYEGYDPKKWFEEWVKRELEKHGINLDYELYSKTARLELPRTYVKKLGIDPVELWKIIDAANNRYRKKMLAERKIKAFPDVLALEELKKLNLKLAAVSNASLGNTLLVLRAFDLNKYFDLVLGKDYSNLDGVKPNPYLIQKALRMLNLRPEEAIVVGDSSNDVLAAHGAGVNAVNMIRFGKVEGADYYVKDLWELVELVKGML